MIKHIFLYVSATIALYASVTGLLTLLFQVINNVYMDEALSYVNPYNDAVRFALATLIIMFPLYMLFTWFVRKTEEKESHLRKGLFKKWIIYITLFIAGAILVGDAIFVLNEFLSGDLAVRFGLKALALAVVLILVFYYYVYDLRKESPQKTKAVWVFEIIAIVLVLGSIVAGFGVLGSPGMQRDLRLDNERVRDLQQIQMRVVDYWQRKQELPATLDGLEEALLSYTNSTDPETEKPYEYTPLAEKTFELCATFAQESKAKEYPRMYGGETWQHDAGRVCFERTIDSDFYKPID